jgi:hypothetical protein
MRTTLRDSSAPAADGKPISVRAQIISSIDHRLTDWNPEDTAAWAGGNNKIARRNLLCTVAGDHAPFSVWPLWSVMALFMPASVYGFSTGDKLRLGAVATPVGGPHLLCAALTGLGGGNYAASLADVNAFNLVSAILTWTTYVRRPPSAPTMPAPQPSPALARV